MSPSLTVKSNPALATGVSPTALASRAPVVSVKAVARWATSSDGIVASFCDSLIAKIKKPATTTEMPITTINSNDVNPLRILPNILFFILILVKL